MTSNPTLNLILSQARYVYSEVPEALEAIEYIEQAHELHLRENSLKECIHCLGTGTEIDNAAVGLGLRSKRESAQISLRRMAKLMEVSPMFLSHLETGQRKWTAHRIREYEGILTV
jgi:hypothetical protein